MTDESLPRNPHEASVNVSALVDATALPTFVLDLARMVVTANDGFWRLLRRDEGTTHLPAEEVFSPDSTNDLVEQAKRSTQRLERFVEIRRSNGTYVWHPFFATALTQSGQTYGGLMIGFDASDDRKIADPGKTSRVPTTGGLKRKSDGETGAQSSKLKPEAIQALADRSPAGVVLLDSSGACIYANPSTSTVLGRQLQTMLGKDLVSILDPFQPDLFLRRYIETLESEGGGSITLQVRHTYFDCRKVYVEWFEIPGTEGHIGAVLRDVTGSQYYKDAHQALANYSPRHRMGDLLGGLCEVVRPRAALFARRGLSNGNPFVNEVLKVRQNVDGVVTYVREKDPLRSRPYLDELGRLLDRGDPLAFSERPLFEHSRGLHGALVFYPITISGSAVGYLMVVFEHDPDPMKVVSRVIQMFGDRIAASIEAETMAFNLIESRKRESIGHLARGVSHDFNNVLMSIMGHLQLAERKLEASRSPEIARHIRTALAAAQRGNAIVKGMIEYSEIHEDTIQRVELSSIVEETLHFFGQTLPEGIHLRTTIKESGFVVGEPKRIANALLSVLANARDAVEDQARKDTDHVGIIDVELEGGISASGSERLVITVIDNGIGMDRTTQRKLFDPFFTTKEPGRGTGLGMALAHAIISSMDGSIDVTSTEGKGTRVSMAIPIFVFDGKEPEIGSSDSIRLATPARREQRGRCVICICEDEASQREAMRIGLHEAGFFVESFSSVWELLQHIENKGQGVHAVVLDRFLENQSSDDAYSEIRQYHQTLPVIMLSAFPDEETKRSLRDIGVNAVLDKPIQIGRLIRTLDRLLLEGSEAPSSFSDRDSN